MNLKKEEKLLLGNWVFENGEILEDPVTKRINNLKDNFPTVNFIGIRVLPKRDGLRFAKMYHSEYSKEYGVIEKDWRKNKSYSIKNSGYDSYLVMASETLSDDTEFEPKSDSKADIKRAFVKSLKVKKLNKKVLGEFVELVA